MQQKAPIQRPGGNESAETVKNEAKEADLKTKLSQLRKHVLALESFTPENAPVEGADGLHRQSQWRFGLCEIDDNLPWRGLPVGLHEVQPKDYRDTGAAIAFALALIGRFARSADEPAGAKGPQASRALLWCTTTEAMREFGRPYGPGLAGLGLDPARIILVGAGRKQDAAWVMEEGLKSGSLLAVLGVAPGLELTPARRLALAAQKYGTPCLAVEAHDAPGLGPALSRWRVSGGASSAPPFDARAPGDPVWRIVLERCRHGMEQRHWSVRWRHDAHHFDLVAQFSAGAAAMASTDGRVRELCARVR